MKQDRGGRLHALPRKLEMASSSVLKMLEEMRQADHLEDGRHGLGQLADAEIAAVLADLLDGANERAEAGARHVGERPRVDDHGDTAR
jgi:hypothetical protein